MRFVFEKRLGRKNDTIGKEKVFTYERSLDVGKIATQESDRF